jgi:hypothetical protein
MSRAAILFGALLILLPSAAAPGQILCRSEADDIAAHRMFDRAINAYVEMTRRLEVPVSPWLASDLEAMAVARDALARAITAERRGVPQGDIFGPEVADFFRVRLQAAGAIKEGRYAFAPCGQDGEDAPCEPEPLVHSRLAWLWSAPVPDAVTRALPPLPLELQYRLARNGSVLLLVDVRAGLVIDLMEVAPVSS